MVSRGYFACACAHIYNIGYVRRNGLKNNYPQTGCPVVLTDCKLYYNCMLTRTTQVVPGLSSDVAIGILNLCSYYQLHSHFCSAYSLVAGDHSREWSPLSTRMMATIYVNGRHQQHRNICFQGEMCNTLHNTYGTKSHNISSITPNVG